MIKKITIVLLIFFLLVGTFILGRQVGLNTEKSKTQTIITESEVSKNTISKTLTSSGQVTAKTTEEISLTTTKYFKTMCVEEDDTVQEGDAILEYTDGTYLTAPYDLVVNSFTVPETEEKCTTSHFIEVSNLTTLQTTIQVSENEIGKLAKDQEAEITLTADETKTYIGTVTKIDSVGTYSSSGTTFSAIIEFENDGNVKIGMSLSCTIILQKETDVASIPIDAVYENENGEEYVNKIEEDGTTTQTIVETGLADDTNVQIISGLEIGEKVQIVTQITESTDTSSESGMSSGMRENMDFEGGQIPSGMENMRENPFEGSSGGTSMPQGGSMPSQSK